MIGLTRTVRFCVNSGSGPRDDAPPDNSFAAFPSMRGLGRFYELVVTCRGEISAGTGYLLNIKMIDQAVRESAIPVIARACESAPDSDPGRLLAEVIAGLNGALAGHLDRVRWRLTPYYSVEMTTETTSVVLLRQQFDFAASHRLHSKALSDAENRALFGKCNNPRGHGHNYRVEPCVEVPLSGQAGGFGLLDLERLTARTIIERFDHKHLNEDTEEFGAESGVMPSVENIAAVCFGLLAPIIARASQGVRLRSVTVWETDKTSATFPAIAP